LNPQLLVFDSAEEEQSFDFFRSRSVAELTEVFHIDETFWNLCVLQMSMTQPAIRYAVAALGSMHRSYGVGRTPAIPENSTDVRTRFALEQCNRSINFLLATKDSEARAEKTSTLVACILYTCLASLQGHQTQAIMHLRNGMRLLDSLSQPMATQTSSMTFYDTQYQSFLTTLSSLEVQARSLLCEEDLPAWSTRKKIRGSLGLPTELKFSSFAEARDFFESILNDFQCFVIERDAEKEWLLKPGTHLRRSAMEEYRLLLKRHSLGSKSLETFIAQHAHLDERDRKMIAMLKLHITITHVYLKVFPLSQKYGEMAWDHLEGDFVRMIRLGREILGCKDDVLSDALRHPSEVAGRFSESDMNARYSTVPPTESILKDGHHKQRRPVFAFSQGVIGPLSTTAVLCRTPTVRREALALLLQHPRREGLWDSDTAGRLGWINMCLEEELTHKLRAAEGCEDFQIQTAADVPRECRVRVVDMKYLGSRVGKVTFNTIEECEKGEMGKRSIIMEW
jgi:hypothetical protein